MIKQSGERGFRALLALSDFAAYGVLIVMAMVVFVEVITRTLFGFSTNLAEEVASLGLVILLFLGLPGAFASGAVLRVDALYGNLSPRFRRWVHVPFHLIALIITGIYTVHVSKLAISSYDKGIHAATDLATPNYMPQIVMLFGLVALGIAIVFGLFGWAADQPGIDHAESAHDD